MKLIIQIKNFNTKKKDQNQNYKDIKIIIFNQLNKDLKMIKFQ